MSVSSARIVVLRRRFLAAANRHVDRDISNWVELWNANHCGYIWRRTADGVVDNLASYLQRISDSDSRG